MILPKNVKKLPRILSRFPYRGFALGSLIFFRSDIYKNLTSDKVSPENAGILIHEQIHVRRIKKSNWIAWGIKYWFDSKFRFNEEIEATKEHMKYLKKRNVKFDIEQRALHLSGWLYLWPVSYLEAKTRLKNIWDNLD